MKILSNSKKKRKQKVKVEMTDKGLTKYGGLLSIFNLMKMLGFRERVSRDITTNRVPNALY